MKLGLLAALLCSSALGAVSYSKDVLPIFTARCMPCHQPQTLVNSRDKLMGMLEGDKPRMPKAGGALTATQTKLIAAWVTEGGKLDEVWWSLKPLVKVVPPAAGNPIDAFVQAKLRALKLAPSAPADPFTLIRRLTYDLHGLPPSNEEVAAFIADTSPKAYEHLVDRLLASPRYGERWARHWLDVVHYADSHGYDKDKPRPNAWPYRDYVIAAFNNDKPYAQFVREQLAGDVLTPDSADGIIATGFLAAGPWDFVGHQELREATTDKNLTRLLDRDDLVSQTMSTFASQTVHCARCHNHKFDPIQQEDYYSMQAVFAGIDRADRPIDRDPVLFVQRKKLLAARRAVQVELQPLLDKVASASTPELDRLDLSIKDARFLATHIGEPKNAEETARKKAFVDRANAETLLRKMLLDEFIGDSVNARIASLSAEAKRIDESIAALPKPELVYAASNYFPVVGTFRPALTPRTVTLLARGDVNLPGKEVVPGAVGVRFDSNSDEGARRMALANWLAEKNNTLTWRSIVNRVWHYHFGAGIVDSPNDFGRMGSEPSNPELLDYLALWFRDSAAGSIKKLHKLIVTSATYRQASANRSDAAKMDADNRYLWRMNRARLDAESLRDSILQIAGKLDTTMGGPAVRMFAFKDDHSPVYDYTKFDADGPGAYRRSIYRFLARSVPDPFMDRLDCPDSSLLTPKRTMTITAIQALAVLNNPFVVRMAEHVAERAKTVDEAYRLILGHNAKQEEAMLLRGFAAKHGLPSLCRVLLNSNEFMFVD